VIKIIEDFLPDSLVDDIENVLTDSQCPWYWRKSSKNGNNEVDDNSEDFQFIHIIYYNDTQESPVFDLARQVLLQFENKTGLVIKSLHKIKANLLPKQVLSETGLNETVHVDIDSDKFLSIVYYVIDSDGDTVIFDDNDEIELSVAPKKGSAVYFNSNKKHRATPPFKNKQRIVLNMVVEIE
jgi:hypothetical protein